MLGHSSIGQSSFAGTDLRHVVRSLARSPAYTVTAVVALALGIGACTAAYSVLRSILLKPLPYVDPDRLVSVWTTGSPGQGDQGVMSLPDFEDYRSQSDVFDRTAYIMGDVATLRASQGGTQIIEGVVTADYFPLLGVRPLLGRALVNSDFEPGAPPAAVMGFRLWVTNFGSDRRIVGRTVTLSNGSFTVVGVLGPGQGYPDWGLNFPSGIYVPLQIILGGLAAGAIGSYVLGHALRSLLFGVDPLDATTLGLVPAALAIVALLASYIPARRCARIDPVQALRVE